MYFPILEDLRFKYKLDDSLIKKFDTWLGIRRKATYNYLNPNQFSLDTDIDESIAYDLFALSTDSEINLLKIRYSVEIDTNYDYRKTYYKLEEIPEKLEFNDEEIIITNEMIIIWFSLNKIPSCPPKIEDISMGESGIIHQHIGDLTSLEAFQSKSGVLDRIGRHRR